MADERGVVDGCVSGDHEEICPRVQAEVDAAWRSELLRRIDDMESGKVELLDVDESHAQLRAELAARRV